MRNRFFFSLVLLGTVVGIGMGAMAQSTKPAATAAATGAESHAVKGVGCQTCHGNGPSQPVAMSTCVTCHDPKAVAQKTASVKPTNPHDSRHYGTDADCNSCHHQHKPSESLCADCHPAFKFKVP